jgi:hypothetical protein
MNNNISYDIITILDKMIEFLDELQEIINEEKK